MGMVMCHIANNVGLTDLNFNTKIYECEKMAKKRNSAKHCLEIAQKDTNLSQTILVVNVNFKSHLSVLLF